MTLATQITLFRIVLIPVFIGFLLYYNQSSQEGIAVEGYRLAALGVFLLASISDAIDGYVARRYQQKSSLGSILDPLADKALLVSAIITLSFISVPDFEEIPLWFLVLVLGRDSILVVGFIVLHLFTRHVKAVPHWSGKAATFLQMAVVTIVLLKLTWIPFNPVVILAGCCTLGSAIIYLARGFRSMKESGHV